MSAPLQTPRPSFGEQNPLNSVSAIFQKLRSPLQSQVIKHWIDLENKSLMFWCREIKECCCTLTSKSFTQGNRARVYQILTLYYSAFSSCSVGPQNITVRCSKSCVWRLGLRLNSSIPLLYYEGPCCCVMLWK